MFQSMNKMFQSIKRRTELIDELWIKH